MMMSVCDEQLQPNLRHSTCQMNFRWRFSIVAVLSLFTSAAAANNQRKKAALKFIGCIPV